MPDITKGRTWSNGETVTPERINEFLDAATISAGAVTTAKIADEAVTTAKIDDAAVTFAKLAAAVQAILVPTGSLLFFAGNTAPTGWIICNGSLISRATYADLWTFAQASGNIAGSDAAWSSGALYGQFSPGDGSTTFRIPNLLGQFIRGHNSTGSGYDASRTIGSFQADELKAHTHSRFTHIGSSPGTGTNNGFILPYGIAITPSTINTGSTGGTETRPNNVALTPIIKT